MFHRTLNLRNQIHLSAETVVILGQCIGTVCLETALEDRPDAGTSGQSAGKMTALLFRRRARRRCSVLCESVSSGVPAEA